MKNFAHVLALAVTCFVAACAEQAPSTDEATSSLTKICTPGYETCDYGCAYNHGPSTDDCIIKCNATGTGWITLVDCGWAQNWPYSSSCFPSQPHPVCQNN